jgi:hypothetical protein
VKHEPCGVGPISSIRSNGLDAAAANTEETVHRPLVAALADEALEAVDAGERDVRLDAVLDEALMVSG